MMKHKKRIYFFPPVELMERQVNPDFKNLEGVKAGDRRRIYVCGGGTHVVDTVVCLSSLP